MHAKKSNLRIVFNLPLARCLSLRTDALYHGELRQNLMIEK